MTKFKYIYIGLIALLFTACQEEDFGSGVKGGIRITLAEEVGVDVSTRSTPEELDIPMATDFKIEATNSAGDKKYSGTFKKDETIPLDAGTYEVIAYYGINNTLALDAPYYEGTAENINVKEGYTTPVTLTCKVANALLSIRINEDDKEKFEATFKNPSFQLKVDEKSLENSDTTKSFYFPAGSTITKLAFSKDGSEYQELEGITWPSSIEAADHIIVTVGIEPAPSGISLNVSKVEVVPVTIEETIPLEWLPKPKVEATGFDNNNTLTFAETETPPAKLNLDLASALQDIKFKFDFEDEQFSFEDREYLLSTDKETIEQALGITLPAIGATEASIDFAPLVAKLQSKVDGATSNKIMIVPQANNRWSSEKTDVDSVYTFTCNKPEFSIAVQEGNVWTKTFTIDEPTVTAGNAEVLKDKLVYQYKEKDADDNAWQTCSNGLEQVFSKAPANKDYQVRAFYREGIVSDVVDITLETPAQLPNSDMEEWDWTCVHEDTWVSDDTYTVYPWGKGNDSFWNTNNDFSTRNRGTFSCIYNCFPAVSFVKNAHQGTWAVELRNTGNGRGNTLPNNVLTMNKVAGELFIGDINVTTGGTAATPSGDNYTITKGRPFSSRPTALKFWYKYVPLNSDTWRVNVQLLDSNDNVIIEKTIDSSDTQSEWKEATVTLDYQDGVEYNKCSKIYIYFASTITTGDNMQYEKSDYSIWLDSERNFSNIWHGSTLTIDDIELIYDK